MVQLVLMAALSSLGGTYYRTCPTGTCPYQAAAAPAAPTYPVAPAPAAPTYAAPAQAAAPTYYYQRGYSQGAPAPVQYAAPAPVPSAAPAPVQYAAPAPTYAPAPGAAYRPAAACPTGTCPYRR